MGLAIPATAVRFSSDSTMCCYMQHILISNGTLAEISCFRTHRNCCLVFVWETADLLNGLLISLYPVSLFEVEVLKVLLSILFKWVKCFPL